MSERFLQAASSGETAVVASMLRNPDLDSPGKRALLEATTPQGHCALHVAAAPVKKTYKRGGRGGESSSALVGGDEQIFAEQV